MQAEDGAMTAKTRDGAGGVPGSSNGGRATGVGTGAEDVVAHDQLDRLHQVVCLHAGQQLRNHLLWFLPQFINTVKGAVGAR